MNANHELERRLADFYATEAPQRAPDRVLEAVLATSEITTTAARGIPPAVEVPDHEQLRQDGDRGGGRDRHRGGRAGRAAPGHIARRWRPGRDALARTVTISVAFGDQPTDVVARPPPPLTQSFTSTLHGISMSYPEGWTAEAATEPWTDGTIPHPLLTPAIDVLYDPTLTDRPVPDHRVAADRRLHARGLGRRADGGTRSAARQPSRSPSTGRTGLIGVRGLQPWRSSQPTGRGYWIRSARPASDPPRRSPTTERGSRRSLRPSSSIPRTPSTWRRPRRPSDPTH